MFDIERDDTGTVRMTGRLDAASADQARRVLEQVDGPCRVDFTRLEYIASVGLGLLAAAQKRLMAQGYGLTLVGLSPHLREVLSLAGFEGIFEFE